jgi:hypothetical protein
MTKLPARSTNDPTPEMGPAMRALSPRWRKLVECLFIAEGNQSEALRISKLYKVDNRDSVKALSSKIFRDPRMRAAIREEAMNHLDIAEPEMIATTMSIVRNNAEKASDRLRAVSMIWDRSNPVITKHKIDVAHHLTNDERDIQHYQALKKLGAPAHAFIDRFGPHGLPRVEALIEAAEAKRKQIEGDVVDADFEVIDDEERQ